MIKNVLAAVDGSAPATRGLALAADIARRYGATLHVVHVVPEMTVPEGFEEFARIERVDRPDWPKLARVGEAVVAAARRDATTAGAEDVRAEVLIGDAAEQLLAYARDHSIDLLVMGRRGVGRVRGLLLGSVSSKVSGLAECPVVTVT